MESCCLLRCILGENVCSVTVRPPAGSLPARSLKARCLLFGVGPGEVINTTLLIRMGMWTGVPVVFGLRLLVVSV